MSELLYCKVIGSFKGFVADTTQDEDDLPEFNIPTGTGVIVPNVKIVKYASEDQGKVIFSPSVINVVLDTDGNLSQGGRPYVNLLAPSPGMNPNNFGYTITMNVKFDNSSRVETWGPYFIVPEPGSVKDLFDLVQTSVPPVVPTPTPTPGTGTAVSYVEDPSNPGFFIPA